MRNGLLGWSRAGLLTEVSVTAKVNNTTQTLTNTVASNGLLKFQTINLTLNYPGEVRYFYSHYASHFSGPSMELFPRQCDAGSEGSRRRPTGRWLGNRFTATPGGASEEPRRQEL